MKSEYLDLDAEAKQIPIFPGQHPGHIQPPPHFSLAFICYVFCVYVTGW